MPPTTNCRAGVALVIGVGDYLRADRVERLRFAKSDADALAATLADPHLCAFPQTDVVLLTNQEAGRDEVVGRLSRWLPEQARGTELVVIYFAGHGMVQTVGRHEEGFLLPYDADPDDVVTRGIAMSNLGRWIDGLETRAVVVCLDCCHAGKLLGQRDVGAARNMELKPAVLQSISGKGRYLIASCDEGEKSFECAELGHGLFTYHLLQGIAGAADRDGDGRVGVAELFNYVARAVSADARQKFARDQRPWTSATWAEETYISLSKGHTSLLPVDPMERLWREQGAAAALADIQRQLPDVDADSLRRWLRFLARMKEPASIPVLFRGLTHVSDPVRTEARNALHALGWETVVTTVEGLARRGDAADMTPILDGLNAFEAHDQVVNLLDRLIVLLKGDLRNRAILLRERKQLGLGLGEMAALFCEIHSPYRLEKVLGQGLFTQTYLAHDEATGLDVVVRVLRSDFVNQPQVRARFLDLSNQSVHLIHEKLALTREARAFPDKHIYFTVRDYIPGVTLQRVLEAGKQFEPVHVVRILRAIGEALSPLHRKNLCHGGIKPSNIFLCEGDGVMLGDPTLPVQGIGLALERLAYDYRYAPPEMFSSSVGVVGPASDFYALGCVAYELTCGKPPFVSDNFHELVSCHLNGAIVPPTQRDSQLGSRWDEIVLKLLARSPAQRFGALADVLHAFDGWSMASKETAPRETVVGRLSPVLRDASIAGYQEAQSLVNLNLTAEDIGAAPSQLPKDTPSLPQIPGYEIESLIGRGAFGDVWRARAPGGVRVAIKRIGRSLAAETSQRELKAMHRIRELRHPFLLQTHQFYPLEDRLIIVMELADGSLQDRFKEAQAEGLAGIPLKELLAYFTEAADALDYLRDQKLVHRDIKPQNLLRLAGHAKVADFGIARQQEESIEHTMNVGGTPAYMPPEMWRGDVSVHSDQYSLAVTWYEMRTGRRVFSGKSHIEIAQLHLTDKPDVSGVPQAEQQVLLRALAKDPDKRFATCVEFVRALEAATQEGIEQGLARSPNLWQRLLRLFSAGK